MEYTIKTNPDCYLISVIGEMIAPACNEISEQFNKKIFVIDKPVFMDLSQTEYLDSRGLGVLVTLFTHIKKAGQPFVITGVKPEIEKIMRITALDSIFTLKPDIQSAKNSLQ